MTSARPGFHIALVKWRNQLLALFCLVVFFAFGIFYFRTWVVQKPFGIILFIGEGLDPARLAAARIYAGGADVPLTIDSLPYNALLKNYSKDFATPDQAAAATALATGTKVNNGTLGVDAEGKALTNLIELARQSGRATGLVTNARLTDSTPASFYAHTAAKDDRGELARALVEDSAIDIVMGGGSIDFLPGRKEGERGDERDLLLEIRSTGYDLVQNLEELDAVPRWRRAKLFGLFSRGNLALSADAESRGDQPTLSDMVGRCIELLQFNSGGYFLVVDAGLMGKTARANNGEGTLSEITELDRAVAIALRYAGAKSMVVVCGDVGIGGLNLNGFPPRAQSGPEFLITKSGARPWLTWATGPKGPRISATPVESASPNETLLPAHETDEPAALNAAEADAAAGDILAFGSGLGADALQGTIENTAIFDILRDNF